MSSLARLNRIKRCKSTGSVVHSQASSPLHAHQEQQQQQQQHDSGSGIPWRTAARANRYRVSSSCAYRNVNSEEYHDDGHDDDDNDDDDNDEEEWDEEEVTGPGGVRGDEHEEAEEYERQKKLASSTLDYEKFASAAAATAASGRNSGFATSLDKIKNVSVKDLLSILQREQESKSQLEDMLLQVRRHLVFFVLIVRLCDFFAFSL